MNKAQLDNATIIRLASYASVTTAVLLIICKLYAWLQSDSVSILATLIDSSLDLLASLLTLVSVYHALKPADEEHRFGHGKAEALAGLGQSMFIIGSALLLLLQAVNRLFNPQAQLEGMQTSITIMIISIVATLLLIMFQRYVVQQTNSTAIKADAAHYRTDLLVNFTVIAALILSRFGWQQFDPLFAIGIAIFILYSCWDIVTESVDLLMDRELADEERDKITEIIMQHKQTRGMHDLRTRRSGNTVFVQLNLELDPFITLQKAHQITEELEALIESLFEQAEVIIHEEPASYETPSLH